MSQRPVPPRGMRDLLPQEVLGRRHLLERIITAYERYGFQQIETPFVEDIDRLLGSEGGDNEKLIYKVLKRGVDWPPATEADAVDLGLRYDLTVPLARFFATHSDELPMPFKSIQAGSVFRAERPQKGRYRQFTQCDPDVIGDPTVNAEIELICAVGEALQACNVGEIIVRINDRRLLDSIIRNAGFTDEQISPTLVSLDKVDKIGVDGVYQELIAINDGQPSKTLAEWLGQLVEARGFEATLAALPAGVDTAAIDDMTAIVEGVTAGLPWLQLQLDTTLVRGQGYYTGSIFEVEHPASAGSLAGGGRYDKMIGKLSGKDVPACGISIGFERLWDIIGSSLNTDTDRRQVLFLYGAETPFVEVMKQAQKLRANGDVVRVDIAAKNRGAQLTRFTKAGFTHWAEFQPTEIQPEVKPLEGK